MDPRPLAIACLAFGLLLYIGAVSGLLFAAATSPGDVGATSTLAVCLLFGALAFPLVHRRKVPPTA